MLGSFFRLPILLLCCAFSVHCGDRSRSIGNLGENEALHSSAADSDMRGETVDSDAPDQDMPRDVSSPEQSVEEADPTLCGNGVLDAFEVCDDDNRLTETTCSYGQQSCTRCSSDCSEELDLVGPYCGDGVVAAGEICDDGNQLDETGCAGDQCDFCNSNCTETLTFSSNECGNGIVDGEEVCDAAIEPDCSGFFCVVCLPDCSAYETILSEYCGDGITNGEEACDDGNGITETGCDGEECEWCSADCTEKLIFTPVHSSCGDNVIDDGEACDDGNTIDETECDQAHFCVSCNSDCSGLLYTFPPACGDGNLDAGEVCDDGNVVSETSCEGEQCEFCNAECTEVLILMPPMDPVCGDGSLHGEEECDDGNTNSGDGCSELCISERIYVRADAAEDGQDGVSWATAFRDLQPALDKALEPLMPKTIWIARGPIDPRWNRLPEMSAARALLWWTG